MGILVIIECMHTQLTACIRVMQANGCLISTGMHRHYEPLFAVQSNQLPCVCPSPHSYDTNTHACTQTHAFSRAHSSSPHSFSRSRSRSLSLSPSPSPSPSPSLPPSLSPALPLSLSPSLSVSVSLSLIRLRNHTCTHTHNIYFSTNPTIQANAWIYGLPNCFFVHTVACWMVLCTKGSALSARRWPLASTLEQQPGAQHPWQHWLEAWHTLAAGLMHG